MSDNTEVKEAQVSEAPAQNADARPSVELTVTDLAGLKTIIDVASQRGAFKANEMLSVGTVYNKLEAFLNAVAPQEGTKEQK
jgi:hypothetical protein